MHFSEELIALGEYYDQYCKKNNTWKYGGNME